MRLPSGEGPRVAVVVLSFNGCELTVGCLESLERSDWPNTHVVVVDNASTDGTASTVRARFPGFTLIVNHANLGFPAGNNVGIRHALATGADHVLLLNNDTTVAPDCVRRMVAEAQNGPARILCPLVHYSESPDVVWYAGSRWDPAKVYNGGYEGRGQRDTGQFTGVRETGVATGAAMLIPRPVLEGAGLLAEELFLQGEDVEFSARAGRAGFGVAVVCAARVWHNVSATSGGEHSPLIAYYSVRNALTVAQRYHPRGRVRRLVYELLLTTAFLAHACRADRVLDNWRGILAGWSDHRAGRLGKRRD